MEPPPPTKPSEKPTIEPENSPSAACASCVDISSLATVPNGLVTLGVSSVREAIDDVPCGARAKLPASGHRQLGDMVVELTGGEVLELVEQRLTLLERARDVSHELVLAGVVPQHDCPPVVGFPLAEDRTKVEINDVVCLQAAVRRFIAKGRQRVWTGADDAAVPVPPHLELVARERVDLLVELRLQQARPDQPAPDDGVEQPFCSELGVPQRKLASRLVAHWRR